VSQERLPPTNDEPPEPDPDDSPFWAPPIEGIPYKKGSLEDRAIKRVIREAEEEQLRAETS
jgi:hypothetical protein